MPDAQSESPFDLTGRVALVTGAGRGIGRSIALGLAAAGADVAVSARSANQLDEVCDEVRTLGRRAMALPADLADLDALAGVFGAVAAEFGQLDILFNNAGTGFRKPLLDITPADWDHVADLNLRSLFFACQHGIRAHGTAWIRTDHQHGLPHLISGLRPGLRLRRNQGRRRATHQGAGRGIRPKRNHHQRHRPRLRLHRTHPPTIRRPRNTRLANEPHSPRPPRRPFRHGRHRRLPRLRRLGLPHRRRDPRRRRVARGLTRTGRSASQCQSFQQDAGLRRPLNDR